VAAIDQFHAAHPSVALEVDVQRHPYSFLGDSASASGKRHEVSTWHDGLLGYVGGDAVARDRAEEGIRAQGRAAGIEFDFHVNTHWQPVDSQRLLLWAGRFGKQEEYMTALNKRHFERRTSASERPTLLAAVDAAGLDVSAAKAFLQSDELVSDVWRSYGQTIHGKNIHSIPLFVFNVPQLGLIGGPFRSGQGTPFVVNGSMDAPTFLRIFEGAYERLRSAHARFPLLGRRVVLGGLSKGELNGRLGVVCGVNASTERYEVDLGDWPAPLAIKPTNLARADPVGAMASSDGHDGGHPASWEASPAAAAPSGAPSEARPQVTQPEQLTPGAGTADAVEAAAPAHAATVNVADDDDDDELAMY